jgi:L-lactate permease
MSQTDQSRLIRFVIRYSLIFVTITGLVTMFFAYVWKIGQ